VRKFGHAGSGGQLGGIDPESGLAFGFLRSQLSPISTVARDLLTAVDAAL
jgi:CubicO group peptidase (beta-lactamase class C family)